ncbi:MAG: pro-sigmaK processing inhibitor BofA family protein [Anaerovorax sp.]
MDMTMEVGILLTYAFGIFAVYIIGYLFLVPIKILLKLTVNSLLGGLFLVVINAIGAYWDFCIPLNLLSAVIVGLLGLPGTVLLLVLAYL